MRERNAGAAPVWWVERFRETHRFTFQLILNWWVTARGRLIYPPYADRRSLRFLTPSHKSDYSEIETHELCPAGKPCRAFSCLRSQPVCSRVGQQVP
jgi:hypothetical protein